MIDNALIFIYESIFYRAEALYDFNIMVSAFYFVNLYSRKSIFIYAELKSLFLNSLKIF